jgi:hypothetical protein
MAMKYAATGSSLYLLYGSENLNMTISGTYFLAKEHGHTKILATIKQGQMFRHEQGIDTVYLCI